MYEEGELLVRARLEDISYGADHIRLYACLKKQNMRFKPEGQLKFIEAKRGEISEPFLIIGIQEAQGLMDELWSCGLRPSEGSGSAGALKKTENHLSDMRKIAFHKLGIMEK
jgi:hypothetical protein